MSKTYCPQCEAVINVKDPHEGDSVVCRECGTKLEIISESPFDVDFPLDSDEEWEKETENW